LIAHDGGMLSVPSPLVRASHAPPAAVLQNRHGKSDGSSIDHDVAVEMEIP
jgi:hypothetical protein